MRKGEGSDLVSVSDVSVSICSKFSVIVLRVLLQYSAAILKVSSVFQVLGMHVYMVKSKLKLSAIYKPFRLTDFGKNNHFSVV